MKLSIKEAKSIIAIETSMDFKDENEIREVCGFLYDRNVCQSPDARIYLDTLIDLRDNGHVPTVCPYCGEALTEGHDVLCHQCFMDIQSLSEGITPPERSIEVPAEANEEISENLDIDIDIDIEQIESLIEETTQEEMIAEEVGIDGSLLEEMPAEEMVVDGNFLEEVPTEEPVFEEASSEKVEEFSQDDLAALLEEVENIEDNGDSPNEDVFDFSNLAAQIEAQIEENEAEVSEEPIAMPEEVLEDASIEEIDASEADSILSDASFAEELNLDDFIIEDNQKSTLDEEPALDFANTTGPISIDTDDLDKLLEEMSAAPELETDNLIIPEVSDEIVSESATEVLDDTFISSYEFDTDLPDNSYDSNTMSEELFVEQLKPDQGGIEWSEFGQTEDYNDWSEPEQTEAVMSEKVVAELQESELPELKQSAKELKKAYGNFGRALSYTRWFYPLLVAIVALAIIVGLVMYFTNKLDEVNSSIQDLANQRILVIDQDGNVKESSRGSQDKVPSALVDALELVGSSYMECEAKYGPSKTIVTEYTRYYDSIGMSLIYDTNTGKITYIDIDGKGENSDTKLAGVSIGDDRKSTEDYVASLGVDTTPIKDGVRAYIGYNGQNIDLEIVYQDDIVSLVSATLK